MRIDEINNRINELETSIEVLKEIRQDFVENKKIYDIGKRSSAKYYLPFLAYKYQGKPVVVYGDETHEYLEEKYEVKEYGGEYEEYLIGNENINSNILDDITMSIKEFQEIFDKIGGKVVTNLEDYIRYKYRPELM